MLPDSAEKPGKGLYLSKDFLWTLDFGLWTPWNLTARRIRPIIMVPFFYALRPAPSLKSSNFGRLRPIVSIELFRAVPALFGTKIHRIAGILIGCQAHLVRLSVYFVAALHTVVLKGSVCFDPALVHFRHGITSYYISAHSYKCLIFNINLNRIKIKALVQFTMTEFEVETIFLPLPHCPTHPFLISNGLWSMGTDLPDQVLPIH
jgi:hypothetical protein